MILYSALRMAKPRSERFSFNAVRFLMRPDGEIGSSITLHAKNRPEDHGHTHTCIYVRNHRCNS